ncbi:hypothetical protein [Helicobacter bilis]|uniref:hypothetical protein n=1 Tax=Helicobacter bilis TaxID=37372 RepID=UPI0025A97D64|nr:hypothetical protein [Helicobacter bilis]
MKKLILAGLLSVGVACACDTKGCKNLLTHAKEVGNELNILAEKITALCEVYNSLSLKEIKSLGEDLSFCHGVEKVERKLLYEKIFNN